MNDRPPEHKRIEERLASEIARVLADVQISHMGREMLRRSGTKGDALAKLASKAPQSGWVARTHVFTRDQFGCIRKAELRFRRINDDGEEQTMSKVLVVGPDGTVREQT